MKREIIETKDGSKTIHLPELNESYHSVHGALQEAKHVFIKNGWDVVKSSPISILEIGFGSGLNAILTLINAEKENRTVYYTGLEAYPISAEEVIALNYSEIGDISAFKSAYSLLHSASWKTPTAISDYFHLLKINQKIEDFQPEDNTFNLIYFDAFGPRAQPEMWNQTILQKMYNALSQEGIFVTYCAKGDVRRDLIQIGFEVDKIPGPPGKREMLRGIKK